MKMISIGRLIKECQAGQILPLLVSRSLRLPTTHADRNSFWHVRPIASQASAEPFLNGSSSIYVEEMYLAWQKDAASVHKVIFMVFKYICHYGFYCYLVA